MEKDRARRPLFELEPQTTQAAKIKVIGLGGGGGNAVSRMMAAQFTGSSSSWPTRTSRPSLPHRRRSRSSWAPSSPKASAPARTRTSARRGPGRSRSDHAAARRLRHGLHHRGPGRRYRHRRSAGRRVAREGSRHPDGRRRDQAVHLRGPQADAPGRGRPRGAARRGRHAHHDPESAAALGGRSRHAADRRVSRRRLGAPAGGAGHLGPDPGARARRISTSPTSARSCPAWGSR